MWFQTSLAIYVAMLTTSKTLGDYMLHCVGQSSKSRENQPPEIVQAIFAFVKCLCVSIGAHRVYFNLGHDVCHHHVEDLHALVNFFRCYEIADVTFMFFHTTSIDTTLIFHHFMYTSMATIFLHTNKFVPTAAILLAQETSGILLNPFYIMRHRVREDIVRAVFIGFAILFAIYRLLGGGLFSVLEMIRCAKDGDELAFLFMILPGSLLQWYWGMKIAQHVHAGVKKSK